MVLTHITLEVMVAIYKNDYYDTGIGLMYAMRE